MEWLTSSAFQVIGSSEPKANYIPQVLIFFFLKQQFNKDLQKPLH